MTVIKKISVSLLRIGITLVLIIAVAASLYSLWNPGTELRDGRFDNGKNGIWIQHGWLGDDKWFKNTGKDKESFRSSEKIRELRDKLLSHRIFYVYPHLCPIDNTGVIPPTDDEQTKKFLEEMRDFKVLPWVGGVYTKNFFPDSQKTREAFIASVITLLENYPGFAGIHINIEPMPPENKNFIKLLKELKKALPEGKMISVAAYPPPTVWHRFPDVHWNKEYYAEVASNTDQLVVMMYDTAITNSKLYQSLIASWTKEILSWSGATKVLLGIPAYNDANTEYHNPDVENIENATAGINSALLIYQKVPDNYEGIAVYCEWEMNEQKWKSLKNNFLKSPFL